MKLAAALVVGLALGMVMSPLLHPHLAQAQRGERSQGAKVEYRVEYFGVPATERNLQNAAVRFTVQCNKLAEEGWEFVGPTQIGAGPTASYLLFKRSRK
jgi:hypothetical protein